MDAHAPIIMAELGQQYEFLDPSLAGDYECGICHHVPSDPHQAQCCGATYCNACARGTETACSNCGAPSPVLTEDKAQRQKINKLKIRCLHCRWNGELGDYHTHRHSDLPPAGGGGAAASLSEADAHAQEREYHEWDLQTPSRGRDEEEEEQDSSERHPLIELQPLAAEDQDKDMDDGQDESSDYNSTSTPSFFTANLATNRRKW